MLSCSHVPLDNSQVNMNKRIFNIMKTEEYANSYVMGNVTYQFHKLVESNSLRFSNLFLNITLKNRSQCHFHLQFPKSCPSTLKINSITTENKHNEGQPSTIAINLPTPDEISQVKLLIDNQISLLPPSPQNMFYLCRHHQHIKLIKMLVYIFKLISLCPTNP